MRALTVASVAYLPLADVMFASLRRHHPELVPTLVVPDVTRAGLERLRRHGVGKIADLLCVEDLGFDFLDAARGYYNDLEFCSALKILGTAHILKTESDCLFLDSDTVVLDRLDALLDFRGEVLITPHITTPVPEDGALPDDRELCATGFINGGVFRARAGASALPWLVSKSRAQWFVAPQLGMYADQLWLSALPYLFARTSVLEDPAVNVAYWNLQERPLMHSDGKARLASGAPLALFHFSGFRRPSGGHLSRHTTRRYDAQTEQVVAWLVRWYEAELDAAAARWRHLQGDIAFNRDPLVVRLDRAAAATGDARLRLPQPGFKSRLKALFAG